MTGADHYIEAERIAELAAVAVGQDPKANVGAALASAQVHATLALAAAAAAGDGPAALLGYGRAS